jgi:hypothetical protein
MRSVVGGVAAAVLATTLGYCAENLAATAEGAAGAPSEPSRFLYFSGVDVWHSGVFFHGGIVISPGGLDQEGFTFKLLTSGGVYSYRAGALGGIEVLGLQRLGAAMPGWRFKGPSYELTVFAGLDLQNHVLSDDDPGNNMRGTHLGLRSGIDFWFEPVPEQMLAINGSASTIGPNYWGRAAFGWRAFERVWLGPEVQALGGPTYRQLRVGLHATAFRAGDFEWSAGFGLATDSDNRDGVYARIGVLTRR